MKTGHYLLHSKIIGRIDSNSAKVENSYILLAHYYISQ